MKKRMYTQEELSAAVGAVKDSYEQKNEQERMARERSILWRLRAVSSKTEYWITSGFPMLFAAVIWISTGDFWKGLAFWFACLVYHIAGNARGLGLHIENYIEFLMKKRI